MPLEMFVLNFRVYSDSPKNQRPDLHAPFDPKPTKKHWVRRGHLVLFKRSFYVCFEGWTPNLAA